MRILFPGIVLACFVASQATANSLTQQQRERLQRIMPRTFAKLETRPPQHIHVVALGDSVTWGFSPVTEKSGNGLKAYSGVFLGKMAREFFYPGGVRLLNPPEGMPQKLKDHLGQELWFENFSKRGACMHDSLRTLTTEAFLHEPDLVLVNFGINDAIRRLSHDRYAAALQAVIDACRAKKVDVIVFSPTLINLGDGAMNWGLTRPYASVARDVAEKNGVFYIDLGQHMSRWGGAILNQSEPATAMEMVSGRLRRVFDYGDELPFAETLHPNFTAQEYIGLAAFDEMLNGTPTSDYTITGTAQFINEKQVKVMISLRNQSRQEKKGILGALAVGGMLVPENPVIPFELAPGRNKQLEIIYNRPVVGKHPDDSDRYAPWAINDPEVRMSFVLSDETQTELLEPRGVMLSPLSATWPDRFRTVENGDKLRIEWVFHSGSTKTINGTYRIGMGPVVASPAPFTLTPLGQKKFYADFNFAPPAGTARFQDFLFVEVEVDGATFRFERELEASRDLVLGQKVALSPWMRYGVGQPGAEPADLGGRPGITFRADADANALFLTADLEGVPVADMGDDPSISAEFFIDARPQNEVRQFGFVDRIQVTFPARDGPGTTEYFALACFGEGYNMRLDPRGIPSVLKTMPGNSRRLEVRIPKEYLFRHEWKLGSADSILGINAVISLAGRDRKTARPIFPVEGRYLLTSPNINLDGDHLAGIFFRNPQGLQTLRLTRTPVNSWSVRIF